MHLIRLAVTAVSVLTGVAATAVTPPPARDVAFVDVNVVTMAAPDVRRSLTVVVRNGRIAALGADLDVPEDVAVIDGAGRYLMPGLAEMHAHVPVPAREPVAGYRDDVLFLWVANGITTARGMLGHPSHLALREALGRHEILGPRLITSGPSFSGASVDNIDAAVARVEEQHAAGYDFVKMHPGLTREQFDAIAATANRLDMPFAGHVSVDVGLERTLAAGQVTIDHMDGYVRALVPDPDAHRGELDSFFGIALVDDVDMGRLREVIDWTLAAGAWVVPTQTLMENVTTPLATLRARPQTRYLPARLRTAYAERIGQAEISPERAAAFMTLRKGLIAALHDGGVPLLLGSDSPQIFNVPGFSIHRELAAYVDAGLTPAQALAAGTVNPATFFGRLEEFGTVEVGKSADLVLLEANPLDDIANTTRIAGVMVRGRWLDRGFIDAALAEIAARYR